MFPFKPQTVQPQLRIRNKFLLVALLTIVCFSSFMTGYEMVAVTMLEKEIRDANSFSDENIHYFLTLATAMLPVGAILGCLITKYFEDAGENKLMIVSDCIVVASSLLLATTLQIKSLCFGRLLIGIACGISSSIVPPYLISISPIEWKGMIGAMHQLFVTIGIGLSFYLGQRLEDLTLDNISHWKLYLFLPILYSCIRLIVLVLFRFDNLQAYYETNNTTKLREFMRLFYNKVDIQAFAKSKKFSKEASDEEVSSQALIFGLHHKVFMVAFMLLIINQLSGINIVISYAKQLFMRLAYYNEALANTYLLVLAGVQMGATLLGGWLNNRFGRKKMLIIGGQVVTLSLFSVFIVYSFAPKSITSLLWLIVLFTLAYSSTIGLIPLIYLGQLMHNLSRVNVIYWLFALIGMLTSELMLTTIGIGKSFFLYGVISYICVYILSKQMVESQDRTRKQLVHEYLFDEKDEVSVREYKRMEGMAGENNSLIDFIDH